MDNDNGGILWLIIGFVIPVLGLILYFVWKKSKPNRAASCLHGAIVGFVVGFAVSLYQHI